MWRSVGNSVFARYQLTVSIDSENCWKFDAASPGEQTSPNLVNQKRTRNMYKYKDQQVLGQSVNTQCQNLLKHV